MKVGAGFSERSIFLNLPLQSFLSPQGAEISTQYNLKALLSPQRPNVTRWLNYLPQRAEIFTHRSLQSFLSPQRANVRWPTRDMLQIKKVAANL